MVADREGPIVTVSANCRGCRFDVAEYYCIEDGNDVDSGFDHYCTHDAVRGDKPRAPTNGTPAALCPYFTKGSPDAR